MQPASDGSSAVKAGLFGDSGAGKTLTAGLLGIGLSVKLHNHAPICMADGEDAAKFLKPICDVEQVPLFVIPSHSFIDMRDGLHEAEERGCCVYLVDNYTASHQELTEAAKAAWHVEGRQMPYPLREALNQEWAAWVRSFRASPLHVLLNGRLGYTWDEVEDEAGDPRLVKLDTKMRGERDMGYEPDLLVELDAIRTKLVRDRKTKTKSGLMQHAAVILKDRWRILNGKTFLWPDINNYKAGNFESICKDFWPHVERQVAGVARTSETAARDSRSLFAKPNGESPMLERSRRIKEALEDFEATLQILWPGTTAQMKACHAAAIEAAFGERSWSRIQTLTVEAIESGASLLRTCEANVKREADGVAPLTRAEVIAWLFAMRDEQRMAMVT